MRTWQERFFKELKGDADQESAETTEPEEIKPEKHCVTVPSVLRGIAGALVGALIGAIPWLLTGYVFHQWVGVLGLPIAVSSLWCYMLFRGARNSIAAFAVCGFFSAVFIFFCQFMGYFWMIWTRLLSLERLSVADVYLDKFIAYCIQFTVTFIKDPANIRDFIIHLSIGVIAGFAGVFLLNKRLSAYTAPRRNVH